MKNEEHQAGGEFYSVYSVKRRFEVLRVFWAFSVVRMHRHGRIGSLFSIDERFPSKTTYLSSFENYLSKLLDLLRREWQASGV